MILDPLDEAVVGIIEKTPVLGVLIFGLVWLGNKVQKLEVKVTRLTAKLEDLPCMKQNGDCEYETPAKSE